MVEALAGYGPRSAGDPEATRNTVNWLIEALRSYGYEPWEERVVVESGSQMHGMVTLPDGSRESRVLDELWVGYDPIWLANVTAELARGGIQVESYRLIAAPEGATVEAPNVLAEKRGTRYPDRIVEIGAHYDTVPGSPGADDNASAVAAVLEIARVLADIPCERTIRYCFFGFEEAGSPGVEHHVATIRADTEREVEGILNLDMVGYTDKRPGSQNAPIAAPSTVSPPRTGDFALILGNLRSGTLSDLFASALRAFGKGVPQHSTGRIESWLRDASGGDRHVYWDAGLVGILITDTGNFRNPHYHQGTDTADTLDYEFLHGITRAAAATMIAWAGLAER